MQLGRHHLAPAEAVPGGGWNWGGAWSWSRNSPPLHNPTGSHHPGNWKSSMWRLPRKPLQSGEFQELPSPSHQTSQTALSLSFPSGTPVPGMPCQGEPGQAQPPALRSGNETMPVSSAGTRGSPSTAPQPCCSSSTPSPQHRDDPALKGKAKQPRALGQGAAGNPRGRPE